MTPTPTNNGVIVVAGGGRYPELLLDVIVQKKIAVHVLKLPEFTSFKNYPALNIDNVSLRNFLEQLQELHDKGYRYLTFAGSVRRPKVMSTEYSSILPNLCDGDDAVLRQIITSVEEIGIDVIGGHTYLPELISAQGVLTRNHPTKSDKLDVVRAKEIVNLLGAADIGQAAVVVCRLCVAVETISGTNKMLEFAAHTIQQVNPMIEKARGVMYKGPKPKQELRVDMPTIGPDTIESAVRAGLSGIAIAAGKVLIIDQEQTIAEANKQKLFIWACN